jgi:hypothetical protein
MITQLPIRIHFLANAALILAAFIWSPDLREWPSLILITYLISLPVVPMLILIIWLITRMKLSLFFNWVFLVLSVAAFSFIPLITISFLTGDIEARLLSLSMPAAFAGLLFQIKPIHKFLKQYSYEPDPFEAV